MEERSDGAGGGSPPTEPAETAETPRQTPDQPTTLFGNPLDVFVRGGTTTSAHDRREAELTADANRRRAIADNERRAAVLGSPHGIGVMSQNPLAADGAQSYVDLTYFNSRGEQRYEFGEPVRCLADVTLMGEGELCLILVCIQCKERGVPLDRCQMRIRQSNKNWELSSKGAGEPIPWVEGVKPDGTKIVKLYRSAGTVVETERFKCDQCGWSARIDNNKVRSD